MKLSRRNQLIFSLSLGFSLFLAMPSLSSAMHVMEGYLPLGHAVAWGIVSLPFLVLGLMRIRQTVADNRKSLLLLAMSGAFIFVLSSLKIPSVTGSCSHMTGTGLAAILFGASTTSVLGVIVLLFQALLLAHGGITTLGANTFSMAIAGPIITWLIYRLGKKAKLNRLANIFLAVAIGDLVTYCVTALQLAIAHPSQTGGIMASAAKFLAVFAPTQLPLAIIEGLITVLMMIGLEKYANRELNAIHYQEVIS